jgi:hypothetical protein
MACISLVSALVWTLAPKRVKIRTEKPGRYPAKIRRSKKIGRRVLLGDSGKDTMVLVCIAATQLTHANDLCKGMAFSLAVEKSVIPLGSAAEKTEII